MSRSYLNVINPNIIHNVSLFKIGSQPNLLE